jgi:hypothetical protein
VLCYNSELYFLLMKYMSRHALKKKRNGLQLVSGGANVASNGRSLESELIGLKRPEKIFPFLLQKSDQSYAIHYIISVTLKQEKKASGSTMTQTRGLSLSKRVTRAMQSIT